MMDKKMAKNMWRKEFRGEFRERKMAIKQSIREMKANAKTPEELAQVKVLKAQLIADLRQEKQEIRGCHKDKGCRRDRHDNDDERFKARHVADVTIPDNSALPANTLATKTWRLRNAGTTAWPAGSQLLAVGRHGDHLNGPERVVVASIEPGQETEVSVPFFTPSEPGRYVAYYRMATAEGVKFGQRMWASFIISA